MILGKRSRKSHGWQSPVTFSNKIKENKSTYRVVAPDYNDALLLGHGVQISPRIRPRDPQGAAVPRHLGTRGQLRVGIVKLDAIPEMAKPDQHAPGAGGPLQEVVARGLDDGPEVVLLDKLDGRLHVLGLGGVDRVHGRVAQRAAAVLDGAKGQRRARRVERVVVAEGLVRQEGCAVEALRHRAARLFVLGFAQVARQRQRRVLDELAAHRLVELGPHLGRRPAALIWALRMDSAVSHVALGGLVAGPGYLRICKLALLGPPCPA